jgi:NitT/TauT family transport system permease protein
MIARLRRPELPIAALIFVVVFGGWEAIVRLLDVPPIVLPAPSGIAESMVDLLGSATFAWHLGVTLYEILAGFGLGALTGLFFGCLIGRFALLEKSLYPYLVAFQTVPKVALAPIIVIWFGFGVGSKIVITAIISFFPILANTIAGLRATPGDQIELLLAFTASRWQIFWKVQVPQALPYLMVGIDVALMMAVIGAIVGEFVSAKAGLGFLILQKNFSMDMAGVFSILIVLSAIGVALHLIVQGLRRRLIFWLDTRNEHSLETSGP